MPLKLFCVLNPTENPTNDLFPVDIQVQASLTVGDLKDAIKHTQTPRLDHLAASELALYKVSIPSKNLPSALRDLRFDGNDESVQALDPTSELSTEFPEGAEKKHLHIVVQLPGASYLLSIAPFSLFYSTVSLK